jgi:hypothetical protein
MKLQHLNVHTAWKNRSFFNTGSQILGAWSAFGYLMAIKVKDSKYWNVSSYTILLSSVHIRQIPVDSLHITADKTLNGSY